MRSISAATLAAQQDEVNAPRVSLRVRRDHLEFADFGVNNPGLMDLGVPQNYVAQPTGDGYYAVYRTTDGNARLFAGLMTAAKSWSFGGAALQLATSNDLRPLRYGWLKDGATRWLYQTVPESNQLRIQRGAVSGSSNPLSYSPSSWGPLFGSQLQNSATLIIRVEAVLPMDSTVCIVAVGTHDFALQLSVIEFYLVTQARAIKLRNAFELRFNEQYVNWHQSCKYASFVSGIKLGTNEYLVVGNTRSEGRAAYFTVHNGVESPPELFAQVDPETGNHLTVSSITAINGMLFAPGRFTQVATDGQVSGFECLLRSADGRNWSFGDTEFALGESICNGSLLMREDGTPEYIYYTGNGNAFRAPVVDAILPTESHYTQLDDYLEKVTLDQALTGADSIEIELSANQGDLGGLDLREGLTACLKAGQETAADIIGWYVLDDADGLGFDVDGEPTRRLSGRDMASRKLLEHVLPADVDIVGQEAIASDLTSLDNLILKSPELDSLRASTQGHLLFDGLNEPAVLWLDNLDARGGIVKLTVQLETSNNYRLPVVGVIFGAADAGEYPEPPKFKVVMIPGANNWTESPKNKIEVRESSLGSIDPADTEKTNTGFNFEQSMNAAWMARGETNLITQSISGGTYRSNPDYQIPIGVKTDIMVRVFGRSLQVWIKPRNYGPSSCSANAHYKLMLDYQFGSRREVFDPHKNRFGLLLSHDVSAYKTAFEGAFYEDQELALTDAQRQNAPRAAGYEIPITGVVEEVEYPPGKIDSSVLGTGTKFLSELRVGQQLRFREHYRIVQNIVSDTHMGCTIDGVSVYNRAVSQPAYIRSGEAYAYASSRYTKQTVGDDLAIRTDPGAAKRMLEVGGRAAFVSNDNTALSVRRVVSNGADHLLYDSPWDVQNNPIPSGSLGNTGSDPKDWRMIFRAALIARATAAQYGIPDGVSTPQYMRVDKEIIRYRQTQFTRFAESLSATNYLQTETWLEVPTMFWVPKTQNYPSSIIEPWSSANNPFVDAMSGMLLEVSSRNGDQPGYYTKTDSGEMVRPKLYIHSKNGANIITGKYNALFGSLIQTAPDITMHEKDMLVGSGRGQFDTDKVSHATNAPVVYYPCGEDGRTCSITAFNLDCFTGSYLTVEDALRRLSAGAGVFNPRFRNMFAANPPNDVVSSANFYAFNCPNLASFTLDLEAHIPGHGTTSTGAVTGENRLNIDFRNFYRLTLQQYNSASDIQNGRLGNIRVGLQTTSTAIAADGLGDRWLESVCVSLSDASVSGSYSGSYPQYALTTDAQSKCRVRVAVQDMLVTVAINGQTAACFNLDRFADGSYDYRDNTAGGVSLFYTLSLTGHTWQAHMSDLHQPVKRFMCELGSQCSSNISSLAQDRRIEWRSTQDGGIEFGRFAARDDLGVFAENIFSDVGSRSSSELATHYQVAGPDKKGSLINIAAARKYGYRFIAGISSLANTSEEALAEADKGLSEELRQIEERRVESIGFMQAQPGDQLTMAYDARNDPRYAGGDVPHANATYVLDGAKLTWNDDGCAANMQLSLMNPV